MIVSSMYPTYYFAETKNNVQFYINLLKKYVCVQFINVSVEYKKQLNCTRYAQ